MKFLHTADWHTGKTLKGRDRLEEQRAVLGETVRIAGEQQVDAARLRGRAAQRSDWKCAGDPAG